MRYLLILFCLLLTGTAHALNCQDAPSCASLGYSNQNDLNCADGGYLLCPFDTSFKKCVEKNCTDLGFTLEDKSSWCKNVIKCKDNEDYTLCATTECESTDCAALGFTLEDKSAWCENIVSCQQDNTNYTLCSQLKPTATTKPCAVGDVYYADGTCGYARDYSSSLGKTPVGVVYYVSADRTRGKVISLFDLGRNSNGKFDPTDPFFHYEGTSEAFFEWGSYGTDINGLKNWGCDSLLSAAASGDLRQEFWSSGANDTQTIAKVQGNNLQYPAAAALAFYPPDVNPSDKLVGKGKWHLPTLGELMELYGYYYSSIGTDIDIDCFHTTGAIGHTKDMINDTLISLKKKGVLAREFTKGYYWSSMEASDNAAWELSMETGHRTNHGKNIPKSVRVTLDF